MNNETFKQYLIRLNEEKGEVEKTRSSKKIISMCERIIREIDEQDKSQLSIVNRFKMKLFKDGFARCLHIVKSQASSKRANMGD